MLVTTNAVYCFSVLQLASHRKRTDRSNLIIASREVGLFTGIAFYSKIKHRKISVYYFLICALKST